MPRNRKTKISERNGTSDISTDAGGNTSSESSNTDKSGCCTRYCHVTDYLYILSYEIIGYKFVKVAVNNHDCKIVDSKIFFASNSIQIPYLSNWLL